MKIFLALFVSMVLNQNIFAEGDPNLVKHAENVSEAGSVALAAVAKGNQVAVCLNCETAGTALLSNQEGVLLTSDGRPVTHSSGKPVKRDQ